MGSNDDDLFLPIRTLLRTSKRKLKLPTDVAVKSKLPKSSSEDRSNAEPGEEVAPVIKDDNLLMLRENREACLDSMNKQHNTDKDTDTLQQQDPAPTEEDQTKTKKIVKLGSKQKKKAALKHKNKEPLPISSQVAPMQNSDIVEVPKHDEHVALSALMSSKGVDTPLFSSIDLSDKDKTTPNSSSHLKKGSASGLALKQKWADWSESELDGLWAAVRRHGAYNWEAALADPALIVLKNRTAKELATMWQKEDYKIFFSSSRVLNSAQSIANVAPQMPLTGKMEPVIVSVGEFKIQNERANLEETLSVERQSSSTNADAEPEPEPEPEPKLLLGGYVELRK